MGKEVDAEKWLASLFSKLIRRGLDSDEHLHCKDSPIGDSDAPNLIASQKQPLLIFIQDYPGLEDYGIFLTQNGKKIQLDKDLLEKVEP